MTTRAEAGARPRALARRLDAVSLGCLVALLVAVAAWVLSLGRVDVSRMNDLGLISVLPASLLIGLVLLTLSFSVLVILRPASSALLLIHVLALVVLLFALPALVEPAGRFSVSWRHAGIIEFMARTGRIDPTIDAYFSWPGFFALGTLVTQAAGLSTALDIAPWAPLAFNLLYLPAVVLLLRAATTNQRVIWLGTWIFFIGNWIGQDYFSPQGFGYFVYLLVLGLLMTWFKSVPTTGNWFGRLFQPTDEPPARELQPFQRAALMAIIVALFATTVYSHQLTPFALLGVVIVLVLVGRTNSSGLPVLMGVVLGTWISYMTVQYLSGHIADLIARIGNVDTTVAANLTDRLRGSDQHLLVLGVRLATTAGLYALAALGALRRFLTGQRDLTWPVLMLAPFGLLALQDYGGEMLLRVYLFSLPFTAFLAAHALLGWGSRERLRQAVPVAAAAILLLATFLVSRYGNERMDMATVDELTGMDALYAIAPHDALLVAVSDNAFWKYREYELYHYAIVTDSVVTGDVPAVLTRMRVVPTRPAYLILTRAERAALELRYGMTAATWNNFVSGVLADPSVEVVYHNRDVEILRMAPRGAT